MPGDRCRGFERYRNPGPGMETTAQVVVYTYHPSDDCHPHSVKCLGQQTAPYAGNSHRVAPNKCDILGTDEPRRVKVLT